MASRNKRSSSAPKKKVNKFKSLFNKTRSTKKKKKKQKKKAPSLDPKKKDLINGDVKMIKNVNIRTMNAVNAYSFAMLISEHEDKHQDEHQNKKNEHKNDAKPKPKPKPKPKMKTNAPSTISTKQKPPVIVASNIEPKIKKSIHKNEVKPKPKPKIKTNAPSTTLKQKPRVIVAPKIKKNINKNEAKPKPKTKKKTNVPSTALKQKPPAIVVSNMEPIKKKNINKKAVKDVRSTENKDKDKNKDENKDKNKDKNTNISKPKELERKAPLKAPPRKVKPKPPVRTVPKIDKNYQATKLKPKCIESTTATMKNEDEEEEMLCIDATVSMTVSHLASSPPVNTKKIANLQRIKIQQSFSSIAPSINNNNNNNDDFECVVQDTNTDTNTNTNLVQTTSKTTSSAISNRVKQWNFISNSSNRKQARHQQTASLLALQNKKLVNRTLNKPFNNNENSGSLVNSPVLHEDDNDNDNDYHHLLDVLQFITTANNVKNGANHNENVSKTIKTDFGSNKKMFASGNGWVSAPNPQDYNHYIPSVSVLTDPQDYASSDSAESPISLDIEEEELNIVGRKIKEWNPIRNASCNQVRRKKAPTQSIIFLQNKKLVNNRLMQNQPIDENENGHDDNYWVQNPNNRQLPSWLSQKQQINNNDDDSITYTNTHHVHQFTDVLN